jgi:thiamine transport system substrate-binding protein
MENEMKRTLAALFLSLLCATAQATETLTVYAYESFTAEWGPGSKIKGAFETSCKCVLEYVSLPDGVAMLNRLKLEGTNTKADIVLGLDTNITAEAAATGLFGKHGLDKSLAKTPQPWTDDVFMPFDYAHFAVIYDSEKIKVPPKSLDELVNGDASQKIILQDPRTSTPGLGFLLWMKQVYGDKSKAAWTKLKPRILTTTPGWSEAYALFTKGEAPMVLSYTTSPAYHMIAEGSSRYQAAEFSEGHYLQIEVAGLIDASPERKLAQDFLTFMMSASFQDHIPKNNWMIPAGATSAALPVEFGKLVQPAKTLIYDPAEVNANRRAWIDEWLAALTE